MFFPPSECNMTLLWKNKTAGQYNIILILHNWRKKQVCLVTIMLNISTVFDGAYDHKVCPEQSFLWEHFYSLFGTLAWAAHGLFEPLAAGPSFWTFLNCNFRWRLVAEKCQVLTSCTFLITVISMKMETGMMMILTISFHRNITIKWYLCWGGQNILRTFLR